MDNYEFLKIFSSNLHIYVLVLISLSVLYYLLFRKVIYGIMDPYFLSLVYSTFATSVVVFLYFTEHISTYLFINFCLSQTAFFIGFFALRKVNLLNTPKETSRPLGNTPFTKLIFFLITSSMFIVFQFYTYWERGIPLFYASRLEYFEGGSGFGIFSRFLSVLTVVSLYAFMDLLSSRKAYKSFSLFFYACFYVLVLFASLLLSGSKSSFLIIMFVAFSYFYFNGRINELMAVWKKWRTIILSSCFILVLFIITIQGGQEGGNILTSITMLGYRFMSSGDIFWYSYPNDLVFTYPYHINGFQMLFNDLLGFLRVYSWEQLRFHPGEYFYKLHHYSEITQGANARHNLFGLLYFGYGGSVIFSFCLGLLVSFVRFQLPRYSRYKGIILPSFAAFLFIKGLSLEGDPTLFFTSLNNVLVVFFPVLIIYLLVESFFRVKNVYA
ncbi:O-antigen polymerase [Chitinophaga sp. XS-30]|uniref:O-antigen polymerase n=1 Tax=Chitinophaga sp. XS-30 TaxID=2604421 RepID=UPI0011DD9C8F|nr:O-antigen polymerase [Chitinophaga sp. XS-30]QEH39759.1 oligosaccharide repeat unit polymerase [Chitinophaga sp. XS-30]